MKVFIILLSGIKAYTRDLNFYLFFIYKKMGSYHKYCPTPGLILWTTFHININKATWMFNDCTSNSLIL